MDVVTRRFPITSKYFEESPNMRGIGWKVFRVCRDARTGRRYLQGIFVHYIKSSCPRHPQGYNRWIHERDVRSPDRHQKIGFQDISYHRGWHLFYSYAEARTAVSDWFCPEQDDKYRSLVVKKVKFRKVTAIGFQRGLSTIVAKEILIVRPKKDARRTQ